SSRRTTPCRRATDGRALGCWPPCAASRSPPGACDRTSRRTRRPRPTGWRCSAPPRPTRSEEHTSELQSLAYLVCRLVLEKNKYRVFHSPFPQNFATLCVPCCLPTEVCPTMRLNTLEIAGFKTVLACTELVFDSAVIAFIE